MLENLLSIWEHKSIHRVNMITNIVSQIAKATDQEFGDDKAARGLAIDAIIDLLQKQKQA